MSVPSLAVLVRPVGQSGVFIHSLGLTEEVELLVTQWRNEIGHGIQVPGRLTSDAEQACRDAGQKLRRRIWDPIAGHLEGADRVFIVPDGSLHLVSFAALPLDEGRCLLDEDIVIHCVTTERDLVPDVDPAPPGHGLLALGFPDYDAPCESLSADLVPLATDLRDLTAARSAQGFRGAQPACEEFRNVSFTPLPASADEVEEIVAMWVAAMDTPRWDGPRASKRAGARGANTLCLVGPAANEAAFKALAKGHRALHVATHGFFLGGH